MSALFGRIIENILIGLAVMVGGVIFILALALLGDGILTIFGYGDLSGRGPIQLPFFIGLCTVVGLGLLGATARMIWEEVG